VGSKRDKPHQSFRWRDHADSLYTQATRFL
jgi:hypothetical protein